MRRHGWSATRQDRLPRGCSSSTLATPAWRGGTAGAHPDRNKPKWRPLPTTTHEKNPIPSHSRKRQVPGMRQASAATPPNLVLNRVLPRAPPRHRASACRAAGQRRVRELRSGHGPIEKKNSGTLDGTAQTKSVSPQISARRHQFAVRPRAT